MYTIGQMAKRFALSRTLLYYDSIGLLKPSGRSRANYRLYSDDDISKMEQIAIFREAGLPLDSIASVLKLEKGDIYSVLEKQLSRVNGEIQSLRHQQTVIVRLLENEGAITHSRVMTKEHWVSLLRATGLDDHEMEKWHVEFERMAPEAHQDFLESLGIPGPEIEAIRTACAGS